MERVRLQHGDSLSTGGRALTGDLAFNQTQDLPLIQQPSVISQRQELAAAQPAAIECKFPLFRQSFPMCTVTFFTA
jgi:hypothetical protein